MAWERNNIDKESSVSNTKCVTIATCVMIYVVAFKKSIKNEFLFFSYVGNDSNLCICVTLNLFYLSIYLSILICPYLTIYRNLEGVPAT